MARVPLAWKNLTHDRRKLAVAIAGISFAVMLMFQQRGFNNALFDSTIALIKQLDADIIIYDKRRFSLSAETRFDRQVLNIAKSCPSVESADGVYTESSAAFLRSANGKPRPIRVIGFDLTRPIFLDSNGTPIDLEPIVPSQTAIIDVLSKKEYGFDLSNSQQTQVGELANQRIRIVGKFQLGRDFANDGNLVMSHENIARYFPYRRFGNPLGVVDLGVVKSRTGDVAQTIRELEEYINDKNIEVKSKADFINREISFWAKSTPIGMIFFIGAIMGFVVGTIICYQILASDISDHLSEFATLKAMGYSNRFFYKLIIEESFYLSIFGFIPGFLMTLLLFEINSAFTGLVMILNVQRVLLIFILSLAMCVISGLLAVRKLLSSDPASLF